MVKIFSFFIVLVCSASVFGSQYSEKKLTAQSAVRELEITNQIAKRESSIRKNSNYVQSVLLSSEGRDWCDQSGGGAEACWKACTTEGYGSQTCASRCGITNSGGSKACWSACTTEGYGSQTCSSRCGVSTSSGSSACWSACTTEGYGSQTCSSRCGVSTSGGSSACWSACSTEGYGSQTCADRCGTN